MNNFCVFILTHGRPEKVLTYATLKKHGYTGPVFIVIDDEDKTSKKYHECFPKQVVVFNKSEIATKFDEADNFDDNRAIVYARNACFEIAEKLGYEYFIQLDDDYTDFRYKQNPAGQSIDRKGIKDLDRTFKMLLDYYKSIPAKAIAIAQGGDFVGGKNSPSNSNLRGWSRKCMNTFICSTNRPFTFSGRINEDVNTYTELARRGALFLTVTNLAIQQQATQKSKGGMTEQYLNSGTYIKSFYSVMFAPSCVSIKLMMSKYPRLHHSVSWSNAVPVIIREHHKK